MLERSPAARYAAAAFHRQNNDFDVYIEDTAVGYDKIFSSLLSRAISERISLSRVFPLGSRETVIGAAKHDLSCNPQLRRSVFIVDGDLYLMCGEKEELPINVIALPRYCIENFLWDEDAVVSIMDEEDVRHDEEQLRALLDLHGWLNRSRESLQKLFKIFAVAHKLDSGIATLSRGSRSICASQDGEICANKSEAIYREIYDLLTQNYGLVVVECALQQIEKNIDIDKCFVSTYVSGKDFVLPLILQRIRASTGTKAQNINIKLRLSKKCDVTPLKTTIERIAHILDCSDIVRENAA